MDGQKVVRTASLMAALKAALKASGWADWLAGTGMGCRSCLRERTRLIYFKMAHRI